MSPENVEIVRGLLEAWGRGDYIAALASIDGDIETDWGFGTELDGIYRGQPALQEVLGAFWAQFGSIRVEIESIVSANSDVVVGVRFYGRGKRSGVEVEMPLWHVWSLRDRKAVRWLVRPTKREVVDAAGLSH